MQMVLEKLLLEILKNLLSDEVVMKAKVYLIAHLKEVAAETASGLDDMVVKALADYWKVPY